MSKAFFKFFLPSAFLCLTVQISVSQDRPLGTWKVFMPYGTSVGVCDAGDKVYSAANKSLFSYEKETGIIQRYDKNTGLSDVDIKLIKYDPATKFLVVAYNNSNLDLIYNGTDIYNIPDIKNSVTTGAIAVNGISFYAGSAFISSDIGISVINLEKKEVSNTYIIGSSGGQVKVYAAASDGINIYAATEEGVKRASLLSANLQNFNSWILFDEAQNLSKKRATGVEAYNGKAYAVVAGIGSAPDTICDFTGTQWQKTALSGNDSVISFAAANNTLYFSTWNDIDNVSKNGQIDASGSLSVAPTQGHNRPINWFESGGFSWEADYWNGLFKNNNQGDIENIIPDGPFSPDVIDIAVKENTVYIASGGADESWTPIYNRNGFSIYKNDEWSYRNQYSAAGLDTFLANITIEAIPATGKVYVGSFLHGLLEMDMADNSIKLYNKNTNNSTLELTQNSGGADTRISAIAADRYNNLWIGNAGGFQQIKLKKADGTWKEFRVPYQFTLMKKIVIDQNDQLWAPLRSPTTTGVLVWSYNGTIDDPSDDVSRVLRAGAGMGNLPDPDVYSIAEDREGNMWVGTAQGIAVYYCPGSVLTTNSCDADLIKVERDGYIGYLFGTESIRALAVDAANRKWVGTTNGVWLISDDGKTELLKFNVENSPLPSNIVTDIAIDDETGEVFIGTLGGLVSYQGDAIAECSDCNGALVYPNPVRPDYDGPIAIKGLTDNAYVKITDVSGTLVFQGKANGTQMIWDGKGYNGDRVSSGVYLVFSSTDLGKEKRVAKILLAN